MPWIVEDGTTVAGANTYISAAGVTAYALARGTTLTPATLDANIQKSMDYLESLLYIGVQTDDDGVTWPVPQTLQWPRNYAYVTNTTTMVSKNLIPQALINAQSELVMAFNAGYDPLAVIEFTDNIVSETLGPMSTTYSSNAGLSPILQRVNRWLAPLIEDDVSGIHFRVARTYG